MLNSVLEWIQTIDIEEEFRNTFNMTIDELDSIYLTEDHLIVEKIPDQTGQKLALKFEDPWNGPIAPYLGYYWFKEIWINWEVACFYLLRRCAIAEPGIKRFVFDDRNGGTEFDAHRFWTFKFSNFIGNDFLLTPFKQIVKEGGSYVRYGSYLTTSRIN